MKIRAEENLGILIAMGGFVWAAFQVRQYLLHVSPFWVRAEPLEVCALGIVVWLHAKWRRSVSG
ncbi:MAG TPA: hypothetical protein VES66_10280 [Terriglobales bacterium]|nr:hypothetical protein [Terriglobales bacterium]